jgi:hypothetical protein
MGPPKGQGRGAAAEDSAMGPLRRTAPWGRWKDSAMGPLEGQRHGAAAEDSAVGSLIEHRIEKLQIL